MELDNKTIFDRQLRMLSRITNRDLQKELEQLESTNHFKGTIGLLDLFQECFGARCTFVSGYEVPAIEAMQNLIVKYLPQFVSQKLDNSNSAPLALCDIRSLVIACHELCCVSEPRIIEAKHLFYNQIQNQFASFEQAIQKTEALWNLKIDIHMSWQKLGFKFYRVVGCGTHILTPKEAATLAFNKAILVVDNPGPILEFVKRSEIGDQKITPVFVRTDDMSHSYWMLVIKYDENVWVLTDCEQIKNEYTASASRNPWYRIDGKSDILYDWYSMVFNRMEKCSLPVVQHDKNTIVHVLNQDSIGTDKTSLLQFEFDMIAMYWFVKEWLVQVCVQPQMYEKSIGTFTSQTNDMKLLESREMLVITNTDSDAFYYPNKDKAIEHLNDTIISTEPSTALVPISTTLAKVEEIRVVSQLLHTPDTVNNIVRWHERNELATKIQNKLLEQEKADKDLLKLMILQSINLKNILSWLFSYKAIYVHHDGLKTSSYFGSHSGNNDQLLFVKSSTYIEDCFPSLYIPIDQCHHNDASRLALFVCKSWHDLCLLCGCTRDELPDNFKNYKYFQLLPYYGNPILDNVDPVLRATCEEPMQRKYPNRFVVGLDIAKETYKELKKHNKTKDLYVYCNDAGQVIKTTTEKPEYEFRILQ